MVDKTKVQEVSEKFGDFIEAKIAENGGKYIIRFDDVEQMNEFAE